jgi:hypothetical protein
VSGAPTSHFDVISLSLHHHVTRGIGYDVIIDAWWTSHRAPEPAVLHRHD